MSEQCPRDKKLKDEETRKADVKTDLPTFRMSPHNTVLEGILDRLAKLEAAACQCTCGKC
jgi:hypothetical protein